MITNIFVFIMGSIVGSFLNVCIYRLPRCESIVYPPSHCPNCKKNIFWYDNIPILSFLILKGKCRSCKSKISIRYFLVELLTAALLLALFIGFGLTPKFFAYAIMSCGLIIATFVDFEIHEIPDQISLGGILAGLLISYLFPSLFDEASRMHGFLASFIGALTGGGSIYLMGFLGEMAFKKEAMGGGDVKLMAMIGSFIGWKWILLTFFLAPIFGSIAGISLKIKYGREIIPYGPYLSLAAIVAIFFGDNILRLLFFGSY